MGPPQKPTPNTDRSNKKRKLADRDVNNAPNATQVTHRQQLDDAADSRYYDPDQSMEERRAVRKEYRDLSRDLTGKTQVLISASRSLSFQIHGANILKRALTA